MQLALFPACDRAVLTEELFEAYYECRHNKRNTINALRFEMHLESNLFELAQELYEGSYSPGRSIAFMVKRPVLREVFAADFRDRVVHHFLIAKLNPLFEAYFIENSYACRVGKGTHYGVIKVRDFIEACSSHHTRPAYVLKLDVQGFFMHINRKLLYQRLLQFVGERYTAQDKPLVLDLIAKIIFNDPAKHCIIKGSRKDWKNLPKNKSLFHSPPDCGLPIGNLTSQIFANFYLHPLDVYVSQTLGIERYGRYVDDFVLVHRDARKLTTCIGHIREFLATELSLTLHPKKIYLQPHSKGVKFLGLVIKPGRLYVASRLKGNFYKSIVEANENLEASSYSKDACKRVLSSTNSYLGLMKHYSTYRLRRKMVGLFLAENTAEHCDVNINFTVMRRKSGGKKQRFSFSDNEQNIFPSSRPSSLILAHSITPPTNP